MHYHKSFLTLLLILLISSRVFSQQQIYTYSQYADNLTPINAAYSMLNKSGSVSVLGHRQFIGIEDAPSSLLFNGSLPIRVINASTGIYLLNDLTPLVRQLEVNAFFAKSIQITGDQYLSVSINGGLRNYAANYSALDASDPEFITNVRDTKPNIGFGIMYYSEKFYLGLSMPQLTFGALETAQRSQTDYLKSYYYFSGAYIFNIAQDFKLKPATLVSYAKNRSVIARMSGILYLADKLGVGFAYSSEKTIAGILSVNFNKLKIGYSYETGASGSNSSGGINNARNEISFAYRFGKPLSPKLL